MRTSLRAGMLIGGTGSIALSVLQARIGLAVAPCLVMAGVISGLAIAKWLDRPSYGRQLGEGARGGLLACGLPAFVSLLSLLVAGQRDMVSLASTAHFFGLDFSPAVERLSGLGWAGIDVVVLAASAIAGIVCSALLVQVFAWSKSARAVQVVQQARLTAVAVQRANPTNGPSLLPPPSERSAQGELVAIGAPLMAAQAHAGSAIASPSVIRRSGAVGADGNQATAAMRMSPPLVAAPPQTMQPQTAQRYMPPAQPAPTHLPPQATPPAPQRATPARASRTPRSKTSVARRMESRLNEQMRQALDAWAAHEDGLDNETALDEPAVSTTKRAPKPSKFLNSERPPAKRNRKKNQTRDWLC